MTQLVEPHVLISGNSVAQGFGGSIRGEVTRIFSEFFFNGKRTLDTGCLGSDFSLEFFLQKITGFSLPYRCKSG